MKDIKTITKNKGKLLRKISKKISVIFGCALLSITILSQNVLGAAQAGNGTFTYGGYSWLNSGSISSTTLDHMQVDGNTVSKSFIQGYLKVNITLNKVYSSGSLVITFAGISGINSNYNIYCKGGTITGTASTTVTVSPRGQTLIELYIITSSTSYSTASAYVSKITGANMSTSGTDNQYLHDIDAKLSSMNTTLSNIDGNVDDIVNDISSMLTSLNSINNTLTGINSDTQDLNDKVEETNQYLNDILTAINNLNSNYHDTDNIYLHITSLFDDLIIDIEDLEGVYDLNYRQPFVDDSAFQESNNFITHIYSTFIERQDMPEIRSIIIVSIILVIVGWFL